MPVEIKELVIKAVVTSDETRLKNTALTPEEIMKLKKEITKEVTEKVLKTLQQKNER